MTPDARARTSGSERSPLATRVALAGVLGALAVVAGGCVGKSGAIYSRTGTDPMLDAGPGVDLPVVPDAMLFPDVPIGGGPDLPLGGADVPAANPCADNFTDGTETDIDCGGAVCAKCVNGKRCALATDCLG